MVLFTKLFPMSTEVPTCFSKFHNCKIIQITYAYFHSKVVIKLLNLKGHVSQA